MDSKGIVAAVLNALNTCTIPFMIVGSLSSNAYGIPRSTKDADLVLQLGSFPLSKLLSHLPSGFSIDPQIGFETITSTTRYRLKYAALSFTVELFELSDDPHDQLRFTHRVTTTYNGVAASLPRVEDVIIQKLRWSLAGKSRAKDVDDVANVLAVQTAANLDLAYIRHWTDQHGTRELFEKLLSEIPAI